MKNRDEIDSPRHPWGMTPLANDPCSPADGRRDEEREAADEMPFPISPPPAPWPRVFPGL